MLNGINNIPTYSSNQQYGFNMMNRQNTYRLVNSSFNQNRIDPDLNINPGTISNLLRERTTGIALPQGLKDITFSRVVPQYAIKTYQNNDDFYNSITDTIRKKAQLYNNTYPVLRQEVNILPGNAAQSKSSGLFSSPPLRTFNTMMKEGIQEYRRIDGGIFTQPPQLLSESAGLYNKIAPKLLQESTLF